MSGLACVINVGGPQKPETQIPVSTESALSLDNLWTAALDGAQETGQVTLVVNEAQLTSLLAFNLQEMEDPLFDDPQVYLRNGQLEVYGTARRGNFQANTRMVLVVNVDEHGVPELELTSADFGPWPVPDGLLTGLSAMLDEAFTGRVGPAATGIRVENVLIDNGLMAITGRIR